MRFEWDEAKRRSNLKKHHIDFVDCDAVFSEPTVTIEDARFDYGEPRFLTFGFIDEVVVVVAHTDRVGVTRLISARKATRDEKSSFFQTLGIPY